MVLERASERCVAGHFAGEAIPGRIESGGDADLRSLFVADDRLQSEEAVENFRAVALDRPHRRADLFVGVATQVLFEKVDQTGFALERGQQRDRFTLSRLLRLGLLEFDRLRFGSDRFVEWHQRGEALRRQRLTHTSCRVAVEQRSEEGAERR